MTKLNSSLEEVSRHSEQQPFDCIIVGGGSAGMTMARSINDTNPDLNILILEAGAAPFLTHISNTELRYARSLASNVRNQTAYNQKLSDGSNFGTFYGCLGGRGLFWNGASPRFRSHDLQNWPEEIDLNPHYGWAESEFRVNTGLGQTALANNIISRINSGTDLKAEAGPFAVDYDTDKVGSLRAGIASGFSLFFRGLAQDIFDDKIQICINSFVHELIHDNNKVSGVLVSETGQGEKLQIHGRSVVLAGGGIESILLALKSNLPDDSGRIGFGLQEHLFYDCWFNGTHLYQNNPDTAIVYIPSSSLTSEQWELHAPGRSLFTLDNGEDWDPQNTEPYRIMIRSFCGTDKNANNRVELGDSSKLGGSIVYFDYTDDDNRRKDQMLKNAKQIQRSLNLEVVGDLAVDSPERFRPPGSSYHEAGGLDMGKDPKNSVTNTDGAFHKIENLISADAASFPEIGATNPHLTIVAVARHKGIQLAKTLSK
ncbi:GMC oxidoreductase [Flavivirga spongiicola]|uniref:GMC family oxidoreductase n=1 Tax=Flavivirga spongiicola TaxID=421621 RepID=A0ABU7XN14_9FLAO|nr:GMC family oxidoreductase [Flavivirga sp. MEBiC05379]MDO5981590.1 GMC family oxidoreductase [Flavivirga sp. MEBiC05379]